MKLDHIAVTQLFGNSYPEGQYQIRAELRDEPPGAWRTRFQKAWYGSPACRRLCSEVQMEGKSIYVHINGAGHVPVTVSALKMLMVRLDEKPHAKPRSKRNPVV
jgi:hypothetical protein